MWTSILALIGSLAAIILVLVKRKDRKEQQIPDYIFDQYKRQEKAGQEASKNTSDVDTWVDKVERDGF